jgi:lysozyme
MRLILKKQELLQKKQSAQMKKTNQEVKEALVSVNFQLGTSWTTKFPTAWKHMKVGNIDRAISEIKYTAEGSRTKSNWNKQTPVRVLDFVNALETLN